MNIHINQLDKTFLLTGRCAEVVQPIQLSRIFYLESYFPVEKSNSCRLVNTISVVMLSSDYYSSVFVNSYDGNEKWDRFDVEEKVKFTYIKKSVNDFFSVNPYHLNEWYS